MPPIQRAIVAGIAILASDLTPAQIAAARHNLTPGAPYEQDPDVTTDLATIQRIRALLPTWKLRGAADLEWRLRQLDAAEDRLLAAHGYPVPTDEQRYEARQAMRTAADVVQAAADRAHPPADCPRCRAWEDCPDADRAHRDALHADWVNRWTAPLYTAA
ncbi:hypothetical protein Kpho02_60080 [Kitasatospora phosalacinea]|uniref:Uncharacterized protein n=1 Tax=Kitasatospora phosalacinea TaxID=2065 RepID=A0A9W6QB09_9ACTN|nr:hypothetical protein [Kitasatospora phosalacinea]GLW73710.1 hypothetical protein Kpho02_60080 [Kitasatospora phosalacinea]